MLPTVQKSKVSFIWLVQKQEEHNLGNSLSVVIAILQLMELLERLPSRWNQRGRTSLQLKPFGRLNPRKCWWNSQESLKKGVYSKDFILALIAKYGVACGVGYVVGIEVRPLMHLAWKNV